MLANVQNLMNQVDQVLGLRYDPKEEKTYVDPYYKFDIRNLLSYIRSDVDINNYYG
jgi:hypothetical protein